MVFSNRPKCQRKEDQKRGIQIGNGVVQIHTMPNPSQHMNIKIVHVFIYLHFYKFSVQLITQNSVLQKIRKLLKSYSIFLESLVERKGAVRKGFSNKDNCSLENYLAKCIQESISTSTVIGVHLGKNTELNTKASCW